MALLSLCIGGINTVDLYMLKKEDNHDGIIGYKRAKNCHSRRDGAYMEMRVEPFVKSKSICLRFIAVIVILIASMQMSMVASRKSVAT